MFCQKCRTPLRLDSSLEDLNPAAYDLLVANTSQQPPPPPNQPSAQPAHPQEKQRKSLYDAVTKNGPVATIKRHANAARDSTMSFIFLGDSVMQPPSRTAAAAAGQLSVPPPVASVSTASGRPGLLGRISSDRASANNAAVEEDDDDDAASNLERINKLFEILSARSDIDHPVCVECTDLLVEALQRRLEATTRERDAFAAHLKQARAAQPSDADQRRREAELAAARRDEAAALTELRRLEGAKAAADAEVAALEAEARALDEDEDAFWRERNAFSARLAAFQAERDGVNARFDHDGRLLEKLQRSNVYNDTFCISHDGTFATINGLRLGRLASRPVDWPEINAAWGHALLLVDIVAGQLGYAFDGYEPQPMGSTSRIVRLEPVASSPSSSRRFGGGGGGSVSSVNAADPPPAKRTVLELFSSGDMLLGLTFVHRKFNVAMVAFLELVRQLGVFVRDQTAAAGHPLSLPYRIEGDRIGDVSIKLGMAQDDGWTKACKLTLTCCKFLLAHASNVNTARRDAA